MDRFECLICGQTRPADVFSTFCPDCREPMLVAREVRPRVVHEAAPSAVEKWRDFLPLDDDSLDPGLNEGSTPLVALTHLGPETGRFSLFAKDETRNPTGSFKDRGTAVAVRKAVSLGFQTIGTVSTGNMAASTAAYGARTGRRTIVLLKEGSSRAALRGAGIFGPLLVSVDGDYGRLFHDSLAIGRETGVYFMNSVDPYRVEGYKVAGFEVFRTMGDRVPDFVIIPVSSGGHFLGWVRAFEDLRAAGLASRMPTLVGVQAEGCAPLVRAFAAGRERYERLARTDTIAHAISNPAPPAGNSVLKKVSEHGGILLAVSDEEMLAAQALLAAKEGMFVQPESATTLAAALRLGREGRIRRDDTVVLVTTGSGLKALAALEASPLEVHRLALEGLAENLGRLVTGAKV
jgi:threonine synthase